MSDSIEERGLSLGFDDGETHTVSMESEGIWTGDNRAQHRVVFRGRTLDRVCGAAFALWGYQVSPSLRALGLHRYKNGPTTTIHFHRERDPDFERVLLSRGSGPGMRVHVTSIHGSSIHDFRLGASMSKMFLSRLAQSAEWDADGHPATTNVENDVLARAMSTFPPELFPRVADVGGGEGRLALAMREFGYDPVIIDPTPASVGLPVLSRRFQVKDAEGFDLIVAVGPCGASQKLMRAAKGTPTVFVPCMCRSVWPGTRHPILEASAFLTRMKVDFRKEGRVFWTGSPAP